MRSRAHEEYKTWVMDRSTLITEVANKIPDANGNDCTLVAVDGRDASGKTMFADELASACRQMSSRSVIRISIDDFHNTRALRYRLGKQSPQGFWLDSYDYDRFRKFVLEPLSAGGSRRYKRRCHDLETDEVFDDEAFEEVAPPSSIVIVDGLFLHRPGLVGVWHMSVYLHAEAEVCAERMRVRDGFAPRLVPEDRYFGGVMLYLEACDPRAKATVVIDNSCIEKPVLLKGLL